MKLLTFKTANGLRLGVKTEKGIFDVTRALDQVPAEENFPQTMEQVLTGGETALVALKSYIDHLTQRPELFFNETDLSFGASVPSPGKIICIGRNYRKHAEETKSDVPETPILFNKFSNALAAHRETINIPFVSQKVDYEAELVVVMGKRARRVSKENALKHVFGYTCGNDISARISKRGTVNGCWEKPVTVSVP